MEDGGEPRKLSATTYTSFVLLGGANLVPWQANLALADYYAWRYSSNVMEFAFPAVSTSVLLLTCSLLVVFGSRLTFDVRIASTTVAMACATMAVPLLDLGMSMGAISLTAGFWLTMFVVSLNAMCSASAQNALYALASVVGGTATQALQLGNGVVGVLAVLLRVATMVGLSPTLSVWLFCLLASGSLLLSLCAYRSVTSEAECGATLRAHERRRAQRGREDRQDTSDPPVGTKEEPMLGGDARPRPSTAATLRLVWLEAGCVFLVFLVCLTCFPGLTTSIVSTSWHLGSWYPLLLVATYNGADFVGKSLPAQIKLFGSAALPYYVLVHVCFVPAFLLLLQAMAATPRSNRHANPPCQPAMPTLNANPQCDTHPR